MQLVINSCHVDLKAALRQMLWVGFLSHKNGNSMLDESLLLVISRRASRFPMFRQLCWVAGRIFGEARCYVPEIEYEHGWPDSPNWMFKQALEHVERYFRDDIMFLEPDAIPLCPEWYDKIQAEWVVAQANGKTFLGAFVPHSPNHMTGVSVYGRSWREKAPKLVNVPSRDAWDTYSADQTLPNCQVTKLIQHVFRRGDPNWQVPSLQILDPNAVIFHQDKRGKLIYLLDQTYYNSECSAHPLYGYAGLADDAIVMRKFYYAQNATRAIVSGGKRFVFDALPCHGGAVPGAYSTELEAEQLALSEAISDPTTAVTEITKEQWENCTKKKAPPARSSSTSEPSRLSSPSSRLPQASILPTPSQSPAVLVAERGSSPSGSEVPKAGEPIKDIADVIRTDTVRPAQLPNIGTRLPHPSKSSHYNFVEREEANA